MQQVAAPSPARPSGVRPLVLSPRSEERTRSVVIARLKELDPIVRHEVDQPMLLRESSRPRSGSQILQRLRLPDSREWVAKGGFDEIERTKRDLPIIGNPEAKVFPKLGMEHRYTHRRPSLR